MPALRRLCSDRLTSHMLNSQVMTVYRTITDRKEDKYLRQACVQRIQSRTDEFCTAEATQAGNNLFQVPIAALGTLLRHRRKTSDFVLFFGLLRWARAEMRSRGVRYHNADECRRYQSDMRTLCAGRLKLLRLCLLPLAQFRQCIEEVESPSAGDCGSGPGFFSEAEVRLMTKRCQALERMRTLKRERLDGLESSRTDDPEVPLREQMWPHIDEQLLLDEASGPLARLLNTGDLGDGRMAYHVGAFIRFRVRDRAAAGRRVVVLGGLHCTVPVDLVRSVQLLRDGQPPSGGLETGEEFRYHCNEWRVNESRLWLTRPPQLLPDVQYRLVVLADAAVVLKFASRHLLRRAEEAEEDELSGPFEVAAARTTMARGGERTVDVCNLNVTSLFYDYQYV